MVIVKNIKKNRVFHHMNFDNQLNKNFHKLSFSMRQWTDLLTKLNILSSFDMLEYIKTR